MVDQLFNLYNSIIRPEGIFLHVLQQFSRCDILVQLSCLQLGVRSPYSHPKIKNPSQFDTLKHYDWKVDFSYRNDVV